MATEYAADTGDKKAGEYDVARPSAMDKEAALFLFKKLFKYDSQHSATWRKEAKEDFDFVAGDQWDADDQKILKDQNRPIITFNRTLTMIKAVAGMEINGRHEISFLPRGIEDAKANELLSGASKWMADNCDGEDEESTAFQHAIICGMGWNEHRLSYDEEPEGKYIEEAINPLEMFWDCSARQKNMADARRLWRVRKMPLADAKQLFPECSVYELDASWAIGAEGTEATKSLEDRRRRDEESSALADLYDKDVTVVQVQWWEREAYALVADGQSGQKNEISIEEYNALAPRLDELKKAGVEVPIKAVKMHRKVFKQAFLGQKVLGEIEIAPIPDRFTWTCITGEPNYNKGTWFGLVRILRDPQRWANKWLSQTLHILNTTAKGGILVEKDTFENQADAEQTYARPDAFTVVKAGAISGQKIMPKPGGTFPQGHIDLMQYAIQSFRDVTGINLEILGLRDANQPGILEAQRKQAGMTILATLFDSLRRARKMIGRIRLYYIQNFLSDGRLIRIVGEDGAQMLPLIRERTLGQYDVIVDETPTSPNRKQENWAIISSLFPLIKDYISGRPDVLALILEYSPLPERLVEALKRISQEPDEAADRDRELTEAERVALISKTQAAAEEHLAKAGKTQADSMLSIAQAEQLLVGGGQAPPVDTSADDLKAAKTLADIGLTEAKTETERAKTDKVTLEALLAQLAHIRDGMQPAANDRGFGS